MPLSSYQKLRLQQLKVPLWELRSSVVAEAVVVVEESNSNESKSLNPLSVIASDGENPVVFFWSDDSVKFPEVFIADLLIGLKHQNASWQQLTGDKVLFEELLNTVTNNHIAIFISNQYQAVAVNDSKPISTDSKQPALEIYLPANPKDLVQFKKQLWGAVYQSCYH